jgi:hypothetical protein
MYLFIYLNYLFITIVYFLKCIVACYQISQRYDARDNLCDWDFHMNLVDVAACIHPLLYRRWRLTGLAYEQRECEYTIPNKTMVTVNEKCPFIFY